MIYCFNHSRMSIYHHAYGKNSAMMHPHIFALASPLFGHCIGERPKREHLKSIAGAGWRRKHHFGFIIIYKNCFAQDIYACFVVAFVWFVYIVTVNKMPFFLCPLVKFLWRGSFP